MARRTLSERLLLTLDDLDDDDVREILERARAFSKRPPTRARRRFSAGLLFLQPSLRTRVGFTEAAIRLGGAPIDITDRRDGAGMSAAEDFADTLRVLSGMVDIVVCRTPFALDREQVERVARAPVINGGDASNAHPTQALIDMFALEARSPGVSELTIGICGDLSSRSARSLLTLLGRFPPANLRLIAPPGRDEHGVQLSPALERVTHRLTTPDFIGLDALYLCGLPAGAGADHIDDATRALYAFQGGDHQGLPQHAMVLCPLPCIDEATEAGKADPRFVAFAQSDDGILVRAAVLQYMLRA